MRQFTAIFLGIVLLTALIGCNKSEELENSNNSSTSQSYEPSAPEKTGESIKEQSGSSDNNHLASPGSSNKEIQNSQSKSGLAESLTNESISDGKVSEIYAKVWPFVNDALEKLEINQDDRSISIANTGYVLVDEENMFLVVVTDVRDRKNELIFNCAISQDFSRFFVEMDSIYKSISDL